MIMTQRNRLMPPSSLLALAARPIYIGAAIGFVLIILYLAVSTPDPLWGKLWMIKPLLIVPVAGALGGAFYYLMDILSGVGILNRKLAVLLSLTVYIIGLFLGAVLGLDGTLWN